MRSLRAVLGQDCLKKLRDCHLFIVGVGGIGCELLKVLPKVGVRRLTILDLDIIEETNLNRQFYFRKDDVKKYKAAVAREKLLQFDPSLDITALCDSIYNSKYDVSFYEQFDCVIAAIDSDRGRRHIGAMCVKARIPMVDGGTKQYSGQSLSAIRGNSQCHNCQPEIQEHQLFDSCTVRSNPSRPAHCIAYAKNFYDCFFGKGNQGDIKKQEFVEEGKTLTQEELVDAAIGVFNAVFSSRVLAQNMMDRGPTAARFVRLTYLEALKLKDVLVNPASTRSDAEQHKQKASVFEEEKLWSICTYAQRFVRSCANLLARQQAIPGELQFEKDDEDSMMLVYCLTSLRTYNFMDRNDPKGSHKYLTYYQVKDSAGNIQPAIASTNSIAAATEVTEFLKIIAGKLDKLCLVLYRNYPTEKVMRASLATSNLSCQVCSVRSCYVRMQCDFKSTTFGQLYDHLNREFLGCSRDLMVLNGKGAYDSVVSSTNLHNLNKRLADGVEDTTIESSFGRAMDVRLGSDEFMPLDIHVYIKDVNGHPGLNHTNEAQDPRDVRRCVLDFKRMQHQQHLADISHEIKLYGFN